MSPPKVSIILSLFRAERYLQRYLEDVLAQTISDKLELSIVLNDPVEVERKVLDRYSAKIRIVRCETPREPLYASWNRAIKQSSGEYLACWNVDDLRTEDSLERMVQTLDSFPDTGWTYGDFVVSRAFGEKHGKKVITPAWSLELATHGAIGGPFFMWRRSLMEKVGWFDEQFASGGDFDYTVRLSFHSCAEPTPGLIGYFLDERGGLSTSGELQPVERTAIQLRYGIYETLDWRYVHRSLRFRVREILQPGGIWVPVESLVPDYDRMIASRRTAAWCIPFHTAKAAARQWIAGRLRR